MRKQGWLVGRLGQLAQLGRQGWGALGRACPCWLLSTPGDRAITAKEARRAQRGPGRGTQSDQRQGGGQGAVRGCRATAPGPPQSPGLSGLGQSPTIPAVGPGLRDVVGDAGDVVHTVSKGQGHRE